MVQLEKIVINMMSLTSNHITTSSLMITLDTISDASNSTSEDTVHLKLYNIFIILIVILLLFFTLLGNVLIILSVLRYKRLQIPSNYIIINLAIADITVSIIMLFISILHMFMYKLDTGTMCIIPFCCITMVGSVSLLSLSMIAYDRYLALVKPLKYTQRLTSRHVAVYCIAMWLYSIVVSILPLLHAWPIKKDNNICNYLHIGYTILIQVGVTFVPAFILMLFSYINVWYVARHHSRAISAVQHSLAPALFNNRNYHMFKGKKYFRTLTLILGLYFFTWVLYVTSVIIDIILLQIGRMYEFYKYTGVLILVNCCANPLVYAYRNQDFKAAFRRIITKVWCLSTRGRQSHLERRPSRVSDQLSRTNSLCTNLQHLQLVYQTNTTLTIPVYANNQLGSLSANNISSTCLQISPKKVVAI